MRAEVIKKMMRTAAVGLVTITLCGMILTGCGRVEDDYIEDFPEEYLDEEEFEDFEEEDFADYSEESEYSEDYQDMGAAESEVSTEAAASGSGGALTNGYYGFWNGDTEYMFGVLSDNECVINVVGASSPLLYAEGELTDEGNGKYTVMITETDNDFASGKKIAVTVTGDSGISLTSDDAGLREVVEGNYSYAGANASDVEKLKGASQGSGASNAGGAAIADGQYITDQSYSGELSSDGKTMTITTALSQYDKDWNTVPAYGKDTYVFTVADNCKCVTADETRKEDPISDKVDFINEFLKGNSDLPLSLTINNNELTEVLISS